LLNGFAKFASCGCVLLQQPVLFAAAHFSIIIVPARVTKWNRTGK
jgi:hypothetical protein